MDITRHSLESCRGNHLNKAVGSLQSLPASSWDLEAADSSLLFALVLPSCCEGCAEIEERVNCVLWNLIQDLVNLF